MILALIQISALILTAYKLITFDKSCYRYKLPLSLVASCWAGA